MELCVESKTFTVPTGIVLKRSFRVRFTGDNACRPGREEVGRRQVVGHALIIPVLRLPLARVAAPIATDSASSISF